MFTIILKVMQDVLIIMLRLFSLHTGILGTERYVSGKGAGLQSRLRH